MSEQNVDDFVYNSYLVVCPPGKECGQAGGFHWNTETSGLNGNCVFRRKAGRENRPPFNPGMAAYRHRHRAICIRAA